jgi:hypothetical protein
VEQESPDRGTDESAFLRKAFEVDRLVLTGGSLISG